MKTLKLIALPALLCLLLITATSATVGNKESERIHNSIEVLRDFSKMKESIPHELIEQYKGIIIIPHMINASFGVGAKRGKGIAMVKMENGQWSDPVFVTITGGSIGFQIGVQSVDLVLVFKHKGALTKVKEGDFTIGGDISATAGPVGRSSSANTDYKLQAEVYSYSRSRGLFAGISINGANLSIDKTSNAAFYGTNISSRRLFETSTSPKKGVAELKSTLAAL
jgi:lipid-binding SYLF domain-containing protein